jgi:hypothetical protein
MVDFKKLRASKAKPSCGPAVRDGSSPARRGASNLARGTVILVLPKWSSRMTKQDFEIGGASSEQEEPGALQFPAISDYDVELAISRRFSEQSRSSLVRGWF